VADLEALHIVINIISLLINVGLVYLAVRLLSIFRGGKMGKPWVYICSGVLALALSSSIFSAYYLLDLNVPFMRGIAGLIMMIGGLLILVGMYHEYRSWAKPV
jgi:hypothetical protein